MIRPVHDVPDPRQPLALSQRRQFPPLRLRLTVLEQFELVLLVSYFASYVWSNASTTFEPSTSLTKHLLLGALAAVSLVTSFGMALRSLLLFSPVLIIYLLGELPGYAMMTAGFALAVPAVGRSLHFVVSQRRHGIVALLFVITLVPAAIAVLTLEPEAIWSQQYGRPRLLLGYWHPKEAASSFALPLMLWLMMRGPGLEGLRIVGLTGLLWLIGSRNVALAAALAMGLWRYPRAAMPVLVAALAMVSTLAFLSATSYEFFDELTSLRLSVWQEALADPPSATDEGSTLDNRLSIDSYYVEILTSAGVLGLAVFCAWVLALQVALSRARSYAGLAKACFWAVLFMSAFDSGIVSTGNLMHVVLWAFAGSPLILHKRRWRQLMAAVNGPAPRPRRRRRRRRPVSMRPFGSHAAL
jgi:hypothetical protein